MKTNYCNILEFNVIKNMLSDFAVNGYAKEKISNLEPYMNELQLRKALNETK